jgi:hypothetical protein
MVAAHAASGSTEQLTRLGEPFTAPQARPVAAMAWGLLVAAVRQRNGGQLELSNHAQGGFIVTLRVPLTLPNQTPARR